MGSDAPTVLVVDDDDLNLEIVREALLTEGYGILEAHDGEEGLRLLADNKDRIKLILLDWMMPKMNGIEFMKRFNSDASVVGIPVIMQTARGTNIDVVEGSKTGVYHYLVKPYGYKELLDVVRAALAGEPI